MYTIAFAALLSLSVTTEPSPPATMIQAVPWKSVTIEGDFWGARMAAVREGTLGANIHQCDITGRVRNFDRAAGRDKTQYEGLLFNDSDVYKVMEGWSYLIAIETDAGKRADLDARLDALVARVGAAQEPDGYINTFYKVKEGLANRWTKEEWNHETYCMGHLIEAGVAHFDATGKRNLLDIAIRAADHVDHVFGEGKLTDVPGHEEIELALVKLARATGEQKYVRLATFFVEGRGKPHTKLDGVRHKPWGDYAQDHVPIREQTSAVGHAVRAGYLYSGVTDLAIASGDQGYVRAMDALWDDIMERRVFITGGIGPSGHNEGFTEPYDIPTYSAYQETCASISLCLWAHRMFLLHGDASYMDQFEKTLLNAVLAGVSLDGKKFFYVNPLASKGDGVGGGRGHSRADWFGCACCPPNVLRFLGSLGGYAYAVRDGEVFVNLFLPGRAKLMAGGKAVTITQTNNYPWGGMINIDVQSEQSIMLRTRVPAWVQTMNGKKIERAALDHGYLSIPTSPGGSSVHLALDLPVERMHADPRVKAAAGRVAFMRGPLVYCVEAPDNSVDLASAVVPPVGEAKATKGSVDGLGEIVSLTIPAERVVAQPADTLYRAAPRAEASTLKAVPYFMWANRVPGGKSGAMMVWLPESSQFLPTGSVPGVKATASYIGNGEGPFAACDRTAPAHSNDQTIPRHTTWPRKGGAKEALPGGEWVQYDFDAPKTIGQTSVYWFDDTGTGECRVPASCTLEFKDSAGTWKPVQSAGTPATVGVEKDTFNSASFDPIVAHGLRITFQLQPNCSTGVLEWTFGK